MNIPTSTTASTARPTAIPLVITSAPSTSNIATTSTTANPKTFISTSLPLTPTLGSSSIPPPPPPPNTTAYGWTQVTNKKRKQYNFHSTQKQTTSPSPPRPRNAGTTSSSNSIPLGRT